MNRLTHIAVGCALLLALVLPLFASTYVIYLFTQILIFMLFATSLNLLVGYGGMISFGHAAYFATGGYGCAILLGTFDLPLLLALPASLLITAIIAAVIGYLCVRLTTYYFSMLTLAFGQLVWAIIFKSRDITGGDDGFLRILVPDWISTPGSFYVFCLVLAAGGMAALWVIAYSPLGRTMMSIRENAVRSGFLGVDTRRIQLIAFVLSGTFAGLAGALFAMFNRSIFPNSAWWLQSGEVLIMVVLGGLGNFFGPMIGAATLILLNRATLQVTEYWAALLAIILIMTLFFFPKGIVGLFELGRRSRRRTKERDNA